MTIDELMPTLVEKLKRFECEGLHATSINREESVLIEAEAAALVARLEKAESFLRYGLSREIDVYLDSKPIRESEEKDGHD
jgi:hypothetical protein